MANARRDDRHLLRGQYRAGDEVRLPAGLRASLLASAHAHLSTGPETPVEDLHGFHVRSHGALGAARTSGASVRHLPPGPLAHVSIAHQERAPPAQLRSAEKRLGGSVRATHLHVRRGTDVVATTPLRL